MQETVNQSLSIMIMYQFNRYKLYAENYTISKVIQSTPHQNHDYG